MSQKPKYILNDRLRLKRQLQLRVAFLVMFVVIWVVPHDNVIVRIVSLISIFFRNKLFDGNYCDTDGFVEILLP